MNTDWLNEFIHKNLLFTIKLSSPVVLRKTLRKKKILWKKEIINDFYELLCDDPVIRVKNFDGKFAIDMRSHIFSRIFFNKVYEPEIVKYCLEYFDKNKDVIDVGANIGLFTVLFAKNIHNGKVLSIEPTRNALRRLRRNIELNDVMGNVDVFEGVASDHVGDVEIKIVEGKEEYSSLGKMTHPSISSESYVTERVKSITLDELVEQKSLNPGFIKIDVEGTEHLVFKGAQKILANKRPIILSEISPFLLNENNSSPEEVLNLIKTYEYDVLDPVDPSTHPGKREFAEILCFPKEMAIKFNT